MSKYSAFNDSAIQASIETARNHYQAIAAENAKSAPSIAEDGHLSLLAECISVTVSNGKICLNLPLGIGSVCLPIPSSFPDGTAAQACLSICTTWGVPTGVQVTVSIAGIVVVRKSFGKC
jgi:hypothetical protein